MDIGKIMDLGGIHSSTRLQKILDSNSENKTISDAENIRSDWEKVGSDIQYGLNRFSK